MASDPRPSTPDPEPVLSEAKELGGVAAVIVAAGRSERMAGDDKLWTNIVGADGCARPLLAYSIAAFQSCAAIARIALVVAHDKVAGGQALVTEQRFDRVVAVVPGGARRQDSVRAGLDALGSCGYVVVHDGARPLVTPQLIQDALAAAYETGASCCAIPVPDTVKETSEGAIVRTLDRSNLMLAQTPQAFRYDLLIDAHTRISADVTDDAAMVEALRDLAGPSSPLPLAGEGPGVRKEQALGVRVRIARGSPRNIKVTTPDDLALARILIGRLE